MPTSLFSDMDRASGIGDERALQLALELSMLGFNDPLSAVGEQEAPGDISAFVNPLVGLEEVRSKKSQNMTECVPVPSSEHVAEIVGRQGKSFSHSYQFIKKTDKCGGFIPANIVRILI